MTDRSVRIGSSTADPRNGRSRRGEGDHASERRLVGGRRRPRPGLSRRSFLRSSAGAGLLARGLGPLLAACSSSGDHHRHRGHDADPAAAAQSPGDLADLQGQPADHERARAGAGRDAEALQLGRLHQPAVPERTSARSTTARSTVTTFNTMNEAIVQAPHGAGELRRLLPDRRRTRASWSRPSSSSRSTTATSRTSPRRGRTSQTPSTTASGGTRCRTRSTRRASPGGRTRCRRTRTRWPTPGPCRGRRSTRARWPSSTTTGRASASG